MANMCVVVFIKNFHHEAHEGHEDHNVFVSFVRFVVNLLIACGANINYGNFSFA